MRETKTNALVVALRELKMFGMAPAVGESAEQGAPAFAAAQQLRAQLIKGETAELEAHAVAYQLKQARFPVYRDLAGFEFAHSEVNEALVRHLHLGDFMVRAENVMLVGGPGTGKTHLATAIGVQALEHHRRRVRFFSTVDLVIDGVGHRITGDRSLNRNKGIGWEAVHLAIEDRSRVSFARVLPDETMASCVQFLREAVAY